MPSLTTRAGIVVVSLAMAVMYSLPVMSWRSGAEVITKCRHLGSDEL